MITRHVLMLVFLVVSVPVFAHDPFIEEEDWGDFQDPHQIEDASISYALYGYLEEDDLDVFTLDFEEDDTHLQIELLVPECGEHYINFFPHYAVLNPTTEPMEDSIEFPFEVPEGYDVLFYEAPEIEARDTFLEPIGGTVFYESPRTEIPITEAGTYLIVIFDPAGSSGDYSLATGYEEVFESPVSQMVANTLKIRSNSWLHRDCDLAPDDPNAVIHHDEH